MEDLHAADVIFVAAHSQGCIIATHLLDKLIREGHISTPRNAELVASTAAAVAPGGSVPVSGIRTQKICCLDLCGIHLGPLRYLRTSSLLQPYLQVRLCRDWENRHPDSRSLNIVLRECSRQGAIRLPEHGNYGVQKLYRSATNGNGSWGGRFFSISGALPTVDRD